MSYAEIAIVAGLFLLLVFNVVAFGIGHKRWSIVSAVAAFLVAFTIPTYFYYSAQLLGHEWRWAQAARTLQERIARVRDAQEPSQAEDSLGRLVKIEGMPSIRELEQTRDRWERALTRIDNWRGRHWQGAAFTPPQADGQTGTITLPVGAEVAPAGEAPPVPPPAPPADAPPADAPPVDAPPADAPPAADAPASGTPAAVGGAPDATAPAAEVVTPPAEPAPAPEDGAAPPQPASAPVDPGSTVYVFDDAPYAADSGGKYLGAFQVQAVDLVDGRYVLTIQQVAPRDAYDTKAWSRDDDDPVSVYTELPTDRWLAFSETHGTPPDEDPASDEARIAPPPKKRLAEILDELVPEFASDAGGLAKYMNFRDRVKQHALSAADVREAIDETQWPDLRERITSGDVLPGEYWAEVTYNDRADMEAFLDGDPEDPEDLGDDASLSIEVDLASAFDEADAGKVTIDKVFYRRPLVDGLTLIHGTALPAAGDNLFSDGLAALRLVLQREIAALNIAKQRLDTGLTKARAELDLLNTQKRQFGEDLEQWDRDVTAATRLADRFEEEAKAAETRLTETERLIVELGKAVVTEIDKAVDEVDRVAPSATARGAATPATPF